MSLSFWFPFGICSFIDMNLTQDQQQRLHYAIRHKGYSLEEIIEEALNMFGE